MSATTKGIKITEVHHQTAKALRINQLIVEMSGDRITTPVVNALRRVALNDVPTYAFYKDNIIIEKNTSIFDNDYMKLRLEQFTVPKVSVPVVYLEDKYCNTYVNYADINREKHPDDKKIIVININKTNRTDAIINVTTNDIKYYEDNELKPNKFDANHPQLIVKLRPAEIFNCTATASLGCGNRNNIWAAAGNAYFEQLDEKNGDEDDPHKFNLTLESQGQLDEYTILDRCCEVIKERLRLISTNLDQSIENTDNTVYTHIDGKYIEVTIDRESHTIGSLINEVLQLNNKVEYSGLLRPDLLKNSIMIKMKTTDNDPIKIFINAIDETINLYDDIQKLFEKLKKK